LGDFGALAFGALAFGDLGALGALAVLDPNCLSQNKASSASTSNTSCPLRIRALLDPKRQAPKTITKEVNEVFILVSFKI